VIQFFSFFVLFGSLVLLPLYLQQLMGYNAYLAGWVLAPGGMATLLIMPIVGQLVNKINSKLILFTGLSLVSYSMFLMAQFNLYVDYNSVVWSRIVMGAGLGMVFIPLTTIAFSTVKKEEMGNATSAFSLVRNIAGSFGVAFMATVLARRAQFHQARFAEHLSPFDTKYQIGVHKIMSIVGVKTGATNEAAANGVIYQQLIRQSNYFSFIDAFHLSAVIILFVLPLVFLLKRVRHADTGITVH
jgi:DHA2 family multidrug resistance protein